MSKVNLPLDLFQLIQFGELINEINNLPKSQRSRFMVNDNDSTFNELVDIVNKLKYCYNQALDEVGFTLEDHYKDKLDYPELCNQVVNIINLCYNNEQQQI